MKKFLKFYGWAIFAIIAQCMVLLLIDIYLPRRGVGKATLEEYDDILNDRDQITVNLPDQNAENIKISYNGEYISYIKGNDICIYSLTNKKTVKVLSDNDKTPIAVEWLPDRNIMMYTFKTPDNEPGQVKLMTYNADIDKDRYYEDIITGVPPGSYVTSMNFSPKTNVVYLNVKVGDNIAYLYKYDIMDYLFLITTMPPDAVIKQTYQTDHYIYSPYPGGLTIRSSYTGMQYDYHFENDVYILGCDFKDNVYFALLNDEGKAYEIKYGKYNTGNWTGIALDAPVEKEDIFFSMDRKPYYVDYSNSRVVNLLSGAETGFNAKEEGVVEILEGHLVTSGGARVSIVKLKGENDE